MIKLEKRSPDVYCNLCCTSLGKYEERVQDGKGVFFHINCHATYLQKRGHHVLTLLKGGMHSGGDTDLFTNT